MDNKKVVGLIAGIIIVIAAISLIYVFYVADYTYTDSNIKLIVPTQTHFTKNASTNSEFTTVEYNSTDKNNITIKLLKVNNNQNITLFGTTINIYQIVKNGMDQAMTNASFEKTQINSNYTIYYNKQKNQYAAIFYNDNMGVITVIYCNDPKLMGKLANSFELIGFTTEGLTVVNQNNTNSSTSNTTNNTKTSLKNNTITPNNQSNSNNNQSPKTYDNEQQAIDNTGQGDISPDQENEIDNGYGDSYSNSDSEN
jgi:hypothetical protein